MCSELSTRESLRASSVSSKLTELGDRLLGCEFALHGRGPDRFDCWGLVLKCLREGVNVHIPDLRQDVATPIREAIRITRGQFDKQELEVDQADAGDVLWQAHRPGLRIFHVAIVEVPGRWVLECDEGRGVARSPVADFQGKAEVYRHRTLCPYRGSR